MQEELLEDEWSLSNEPQHHSVAETEKAIVEDMNNLSVEERIQAYEDIHGVSTLVQEDPAVVHKKQADLDKEIHRYKNKAYILAESLSKDYVQDRDFRLMFLRADNFDVKAAARRLLSFFTYKLQYFGRDKLCRDIKLADLSLADRECLESGAFQELLQTDRAGRRVMMVFQQLRKFQKQEHFMRAVFYFMMTLMTGRPDLQKKGLLLIFYNTSNEPLRPLPNLAWKLMRMRHALPLRNATQHICLKSESTIYFISILLFMWYRINRPYNRVRLRKHYGSDIEIRYTLLGFGIPMDCFPVEEDGTINLAYHHQWIQRRREIERIHITHPNPTLSLSPVEESPTEQRPTNPEDFEEFHFSNSSICVTNPNDAPHGPIVLDLTPIPSVEAHADVQVSFGRSIDTSQMMNARLAGPGHSYAMPPNNVNQVAPSDAWMTAAPMTHPQAPMFGNMFAAPTPVLAPSHHQQAPFLGYVIPKPEDVLFGRGKPTRNHPGNVRFRNLMESHADEYNKAPKFVKSLIAKKLVQIVSSSGSRFLKPNGPNYWVPVDDKTAQDKVSQYFRSRRGNK